MRTYRQPDSGLPKSFALSSTDTSAERLKKIERREWLLWAAAVTIMLLLTAGIGSFLLPILQTSDDDGTYSLSLRQEITGLFGVVLLFNLYTVYQQLQIHRIRRRLTES